MSAVAPPLLQEPHVPTPSRQDADGSVAVVLIGAWLSALLLIPDRFTLPPGAGIAIRPHHAVLLTLVIHLVRRGRFTTARIGATRIAMLLPLLAAVSLVLQLGSLDAVAAGAGLRALGEMLTLAIIAMAVSAARPAAAARRLLLIVTVVLAVASAFLGFWEASTGHRALDGLERVVPILGVETFSATGAQRADTIGAASQFQYRLGLPRIASTSRHPIEFSVVMCFGIIAAAALAISASSLRRRILAAAAVAVMICALPLSLSRTGVIGIVCAAVFAISFARRRGRAAVATVLVAFALMTVVVNVQPRAAEALRLVFVRSSDDSSVEARTADYREVDRAVGGDVWAGHGIGQWETYRTPFGRQLLFDNQYLLTAEETGVLGLVAFAALLATAFRTALRWVRTASGERTIAVAVLACLGSFAVMSATFDALYFSQAASLFMFLFGIASAAAGDRSRPDAMPS